jgi:endonuclease G
MSWNRVEVTVFGADQQPALHVAGTAEGVAAPEPAGQLMGADAAAVAPDSALSRSFSLLRANRERPYYDAEVDAAAREAYYRDLPAQSTPEERFRALSQLLRRTHTTVLSYGDARYQHLYPWVDLQENGMLRSLYTGDEYPPEKVIQDDFLLESARMAQLRTWMASSARFAGELSLSDVQAQLEALDDQGPYNCEHVVPQSWFKPRSLPMKSDLHHLFTCDTRCNSFRGNTPFGITGLAGEPCGKQSGNEFEPANGKGPAARATLYFLLRYPGEINDRTSEYTASDITTLLQWHNAEGVSLFEKHRNAAVHAAQGNRNPLIDHPDWAVHIAFHLGLG